MKLEYGKKYLRSDFSVSGALAESPLTVMRDAGWTFYDPENSRFYRANGHYFSDKTSDLDLVSEWHGPFLDNVAVPEKPDRRRYELSSELLLSMAATDAYSGFSADHLAGRAIAMADALLNGLEESA